LRFDGIRLAAAYFKMSHGALREAIRRGRVEVRVALNASHIERPGSP
jgi:hypothetical protein